MLLQSLSSKVLAVILDMSVGEVNYRADTSSFTKTYSFQTEPALKLEVTTNLNDYTRLYFGDVIELSFTISHESNTSTATAADVNVDITFDHLIPMDGHIKHNSSWITIQKAGVESLPKATLLNESGKFKFTFWILQECCFI